MRSRWEGVRADLLRSVTTLQAEQQFNRIKGAAFDRFAGPSALVAYLNDPCGDMDEKDRIYGVLVREIQAKGDLSDLATSILWLGLWPALDAIYRRKLNRFIRQPDALVSELGSRFTEAIARADLSKIHRVAATLVMNTERDLVQALIREGEEDGRREDLPDDDVLARRKKAGPFGTPADALEKLDVISLTERLEKLAEEDRDLLRGALLHGETRREAATRLQIPYETVRKRFQRAVERLHREFEGDPVPFAAGVGV
jgi:DNA-directed RNA polymerase specialized sigma24 family protein